MKLSAAIRRFQADLASRGRAMLTIACYSRDLSRLRELLGDLLVAEITVGHLRSVVSELGRPEPTGVIRSVATMNRIKSAYRSFFEWCRSTGLVSMNPSAALELGKTSSHRTVPFSRAEIEHFLATIANSGGPLSRRDEALFAVYAFTGVRRVEALGLKTRDYDAAEAVLRIPRTKGGRSEVRIVPRRLSRTLDEYLALNERSAGEGLLFPGRDPEDSMTARQVHYRFEHWKILAGLRKDLTIHSFRAGYATLLHKSTKDPLLVSKAMGHIDMRSTDRYIHVVPSAVRQAVEKAFG